MQSSGDDDHWVYIIASKPHGVIYIGMTRDLIARMIEHQNRTLPGFSRKYWVGRLVYYECHEDYDAAAQRERNMKRWQRAWKIELIEKQNPTWRDLFQDVLREHGYED